MTATATATEKPRREKKPLNGVDTPMLFATIGAVREQPELAAFRFRATSEWLAGTHSRQTFGTMTGAGGDHEHRGTYTSEGDHPAVLCGADNAPTPVEHLLSALAGCLTAGIANIAAARGITLRSCRATVEGDIDLQGLLGIDDQVRNGYSAIRVHFDIDGDGDVEALKKVVEQSRARSAVFDVLTNGCAVDITVDAA